MQLVVSVNGEAGVQRRFRNFEKNLGGSTALMFEIAEIIAKRNEATWGSGAKLAEATILSKQQKGEPEEALVGKTGEMKRQLTHVEAGIRSISPLEVRFGTDRFYARFHQYGTVHEPKRRVLKFTPTTRMTVRNVLADHIMRNE